MCRKLAFLRLTTMIINLLLCMGAATALANNDLETSVPLRNKTSSLNKTIVWNWDYKWNTRVSSSELFEGPVLKTSIVCKIPSDCEEGNIRIENLISPLEFHDAVPESLIMDIKHLVRGKINYVVVQTPRGLVLFIEGIPTIRTQGFQRKAEIFYENSERFPMLEELTCYLVAPTDDAEATGPSTIVSICENSKEGGQYAIISKIEEDKIKISAIAGLKSKERAKEASLLKQHILIANFVQDGNDLASALHMYELRDNQTTLTHIQAITERNTINYGFATISSNNSRLLLSLIDENHLISLFWITRRDDAPSEIEEITNITSAQIKKATNKSESESLTPIYAQPLKRSSRLESYSTIVFTVATSDNDHFTLFAAHNKASTDPPIILVYEKASSVFSDPVLVSARTSGEHYFVTASRTISNENTSQYSLLFYILPDSNLTAFPLQVKEFKINENTNAKEELQLSLSNNGILLFRCPSCVEGQRAGAVILQDFYRVVYSKKGIWTHGVEIRAENPVSKEIVKVDVYAFAEDGDNAEVTNRGPWLWIVFIVLLLLLGMAAYIFIKRRKQNQNTITEHLAEASMMRRDV